jgi:hypothetical protein
MMKGQAAVLDRNEYVVSIASMMSLSRARQRDRQGERQ